MYEGLDRSFPVGYKPEHFTTEHSGKLKVLSHILAQIHRQGERVVLVSNYTQVKGFFFVDLFRNSTSVAP